MVLLSLNGMLIPEAAQGGDSMDQQTTGKFIARKRKEKNLTQEQLAEKLGVSNKTISKRENGNLMFTSIFLIIIGTMLKPPVSHDTGGYFWVPYRPGRGACILQINGLSPNIRTELRSSLYTSGATTIHPVQN